MFGVYVHIPFCKSRCRYCDFYSTTLLERQKDYVLALKTEFDHRSQEFGTDIATLYIGGGTPSAIDPEWIQSIREWIIPSQTVGQHSMTPEITMEANPGDLTLDKLLQLRRAGINRLSIGIQSFQAHLLRLIARRHTAAEAQEAVRLARQAGFDNLSIDLIYALPSQTMAEWQEDIRTALSLHPEHISCYCLSYEENTPLSRMLEQGLIRETDDDTANAMFDYLCEQLTLAGYEHYEVSNFALPGYRSRHNSSYWNQTPYLGLGAGAHSFDGCHRYYNRCDLDAYIREPLAAREQELLTEENRYNERIMLALRTSDGLERRYIRSESQPVIDHYISQGLLTEENNVIRVSQTGIHILNRIIEDLFI